MGPSGCHPLSLCGSTGQRAQKETPTGPYNPIRQVKQNRRHLHVPPESGDEVHEVWVQSERSQLFRHYSVPRRLDKQLDDGAATRPIQHWPRASGRQPGLAAHEKMGRETGDQQLIIFFLLLLPSLLEPEKRRTRLCVKLESASFSKGSQRGTESSVSREWCFKLWQASDRVLPSHPFLDPHFWCPELGAAAVDEVT